MNTLLKRARDYAALMRDSLVPEIRKPAELIGELAEALAKAIKRKRAR